MINCGLTVSSYVKQHRDFTYLGDQTETKTILCNLYKQEIIINKFKINKVLECHYIRYTKSIY